MEKNNGKVIAIVALLVGVVALSVGFAAFADTLTIDGSAVAKPGDNPFDDQTTGGLRYKATTMECHSTAAPNTNVITEGYSAGTLSDDSWSAIKVPLTKEVPSVTCTAVVENKSKYVAYLRSIAANAGITCASKGANAEANANSVCANTKVVAQFGTETNDKIEFGTEKPAENKNTNGSIAAESGESTVTVTISYDPTKIVADEDVTITLPTISHNYSSAKSE